MTARDQLKTYIEAEIRSFLPDGCSFCFPNEKNNTAYAESSTDMYDITVEWVYSFQIEVSKALGDQSQYTTENIDSAIDLYRKQIAKQLKTQEVLDDANDEDIVKLKSIRSFTQTKKDQNYNIRFTLEYSVYEEYND